MLERVRGAVGLFVLYLLALLEYGFYALDHSEREFQESLHEKECMDRLYLEPEHFLHTSFVASCDIVQDFIEMRREDDICHGGTSFRPVHQEFIHRHLALKNPVCDCAVWDKVR